jgi:hypothetical protein
VIVAIELHVIPGCTEALSRGRPVAALEGSVGCLKELAGLIHHLHPRMIMAVRNKRW